MRMAAGRGWKGEPPKSVFLPRISVCLQGKGRSGCESQSLEDTVASAECLKLQELTFLLVRRPKN